MSRMPPPRVEDSRNPRNWPFDRKDMEVYGRTGEVFTVAANDVKVRLPGQRAETLKADNEET